MYKVLINLWSSGLRRNGVYLSDAIFKLRMSRINTRYCKVWSGQAVLGHWKFALPDYVLEHLQAPIQLHIERIFLRSNTQRAG